MMTLQIRNVSVKQLPEVVNSAVERSFLTEMVSSFEADRPRIVINCASLRSLDLPSIHLLLCSLEEAMKRNGDVRLSAVPKASKAVLQSAGMDRLFKIFDTDAEAIRSFQRHSHSSPWNAVLCNSAVSTNAAENAA
jgi:anti-anti-sigma factor